MLFRAIAVEHKADGVNLFLGRARLAGARGIPADPSELFQGLGEMSHFLQAQPPEPVGLHVSGLKGQGQAELPLRVSHALLVVERAPEIEVKTGYLWRQGHRLLQLRDGEIVGPHTVKVDAQAVVIVNRRSSRSHRLPANHSTLSTRGSGATVVQDFPVRSIRSLIPSVPAIAQAGPVETASTWRQASAIPRGQGRGVGT